MFPGSAGTVARTVGSSSTVRHRKWIEGKYELPADEAADLLYAMMLETLSRCWAR